MTRQDGRAFDELRPIKITPDFVKFAEGSCLIQCGDTMAPMCSAAPAWRTGCRPMCRRAPAG